MSRMHAWPVIGIAVRLALVAGAAGAEPPAVAPPPRAVPRSTQTPTPADDWTFRPTVVVRRGSAQGSGTIIASRDGETLVLTAAHVIVEGKGTTEVEVHRYNLGLERFSRIAGGWPRTYPAEVVATDRAADLSVLRVGHMKRLPYVARLAPGVEDPAPGTVVTSVGIDLGDHLSSWLAYVSKVEWFVLQDQEQERPFLITTRPPEHGRSGGGLFLSGSGELVGVCIGRVGEARQCRVGIFASTASIRRMLRDHDLEANIARSGAAIETTNNSRQPPARDEVLLSKPPR